MVLGSKALLTLTGETHTSRFHARDIDAVMTEAQLRDFMVRHRSAIRSLVPLRPHKYAAVLEKDGRRYAYEIETEGQPSAAWLLAHQAAITAATYTDPVGQVFAVPNRAVLFLTKRSHLHLNVHFDKTMADFHGLKDGHDPQVLAALQPYFRLRHQEALDRAQARHPKLNVPNAAFFDRSKTLVGYVFIHDDLHEAIKHFDRPVYEMMKTDLTQAWCDKDLFAQLPLDHRLKCVQEEAYVIAIERYLALEKGPHDDPFLAYKEALRRICTTLCSGFFRDFAVEHYFSLLAAYDAAFLDRLKRALAAGRVRRIDSCPDARYRQVRERLLAF
jgi:hypothetical protein